MTAGSCFFLCFDMVVVVIDPILSKATCKNYQVTASICELHVAQTKTYRVQDRSLDMLGQTCCTTCSQILPPLSLGENYFPWFFWLQPLGDNTPYIIIRGHFYFSTSTMHFPKTTIVCRKMLWTRWMD